MNIDIFSKKTKAERREFKKRPRMNVSGQSLKVPSAHAGMKLARIKKTGKP